MDPTANLEEQLRLAKDIPNRTFNQSANRLSQLVIALDEWLRNSGFLPKPWADKRGHCNGCEEDHP